MSWLSAMPLLSTLAALVIIVHSAEEMERERGWSRREASAILDREIRDTDYEQPWRAIDNEPILQSTTTPDAWVSSENAPKRRRFSRKRKRRPQVQDRNVEQEKFLYQGEQRRPDIDYRDSNQALRRRRLPSLARAEESDVAWAKRGIQSRRPLESYDTWVELEEFEHERSNERMPDMKAEERFLEGYNRYVHRKYNSDVEPKVRPVLDGKPLDSKVRALKLNSKPDKSLSEFSSETKDHILSPRFSNAGRREKKVQLVETTTAAGIDKLQSKSTSATQAVTIKEILKKSKGKSLSEILEQHKLSLSDLLQGKINPLTILKSIGETSRTKPTSVSSSDEESQQKNDKTEEKPTNLELTKLETIDTETSLRLKKTYKKGKPVDNEYPDNAKIEVIFETTKDKDGINSSKNSTFVHPALLNQKRLKQRISMTTKSPPNRPSVPKNKNSPNSHKNSKMGEWREVLPKILTVHPASSTEYTDDIYEDKYFSKESIDESAEITSTKEFMSTITDVDGQENNDVTTMYTIPNNTPDYGEWVEVDNAKLVSEIPETTTESQEFRTEWETTVMPITTSTTSIKTTTTRVPRIVPFRRPTANSTAIRQQVFSNRMNKKRLKQKLSSTQAPKSLYNDINLQTASEFIEKVPSTTTSKKPTQTTQSENEIDIEWTTDSMFISETGASVRGDKHPHRKPTVKPTATAGSIAEKTAKKEIDELLNDTRRGAELSRILSERNMTLGELVEHRERGSSQVHLADIFHNSSKEPSPAEPFLSKSLIEPISKETYPLRAILENQHDSTVRPSTVQESATQAAYYNIPVVMDFGNNVNENGENLGIMSLFSNNSKTELGEGILEGTYTNSDSDGSPYISSVAVIPGKDTRNGRLVKDSWNDLFAIIKGRHQQNSTIAQTQMEEEVTSSSRSSYKDNSSSDSYKKTSVEEDVDGDGLIILEDLQRYEPKTTKSSKANHVDPNVFQGEDDSHNLVEMGAANKSTSTTRSVTVATASIIGLAMVLFLLTYALLKWNQQRNIMRDKSKFGNERIATPVFENHNELAHNNSCRSINSMMSSNIYTVDGFESNKNGKDSPVYMWDDLKKPFQ